MANGETMTLSDYASEHPYSVLFWAGIGCSAGDYSPLGADCDFAERNGLLDLEGTVDGDGDWQWDGKGNPTDDRRNTITRLQAYPDEPRWRRLTGEYDPKVVEVEYSLDSLADVPADEFEAELEARLEEAFPGADITVRQGSGNRHRMDHEESEEVRRVAEEAFSHLCETLKP